MQYAVVYFLKNDIERINEFREKYDPARKIINPHITLVFPFPNMAEADIIEHLTEVTKNIKSFDIHLEGLTKSFDDYLFLLVKEGKQGILSLHKMLYGKALQAYMRNDIPFIPHVTLGWFRKNNQFDQVLYDKAYEEAKRLDFNIDCAFDEIALIRGDGLTPATILQTFTLKK